MARPLIGLAMAPPGEAIYPFFTHFDDCGMEEAP